MDVAVVNETLLEILQAISGSDTTKYGFLVGTSINLCTSNLNYDVNTVLGDVTPGKANFDGYATKTLTWNAPSLSTDGVLELASGSVTFRPTGSNTPNTCYGFYATLPGSGSLGFCGKLDNAPVPMGSTLNLLEMIFRLRVSATGISVDVS